MLEKLNHGHIHIAVFGRVSVGKSSLLNALLGEVRFDVSALHGTTQRSETIVWRESSDTHVVLYDTPGINEIEGEARERLAHEVAARADLVLFVADGDLTHTELEALKVLAREHRPLVLVLNKADRYTRDERTLLLEALTDKTQGLVDPANVLAAAAAPAERIYVQQDERGQEYESRRRPSTDVAQLKARIWDILEAEGKMLSAINAGLFAGRLTDQVAARITELKQSLAQRVINKYCIGKALAVAFNPVPVTDLFAAAALDTALIIHLSRVYGLPVTRREAGNLLRAIIGQMVALMGTVWAMHLLSSALKAGSVGLSVALTAGAQGAVAYYGTYIIGEVAARYFAQGKSWGKGGPKRVVQEILSNVDRASILRQAREELRARLAGKPS